MLAPATGLRSAPIASEAGKVQRLTGSYMRDIAEMDARGNGRLLRAIVSSLAAFLAAGARPPTPLARAIVLILAAKLVGITEMRILMFPDSSQSVFDATAMKGAIGPTTLLT